MVKFCKNCGSLMVPKKTDSRVEMECKKCEISEKADGDIVLKSKIRDEDRTTTVIIESADDHSTEEMVCPSCKKMRPINQWQVQTRSADEAPTTFYKCKHCQQTWREYGG